MSVTRDTADVDWSAKNDREHFGAAVKRRQCDSSRDLGHLSGRQVDASWDPTWILFCFSFVARTFSIRRDDGVGVYGVSMKVMGGAQRVGFLRERENVTSTSCLLLTTSQ